MRWRKLATIFSMAIRYECGCGLVANGFKAEADNSVDELGVGEAGFLGGLGEVFVFGEDGVGVGFDEINFVVAGEAEVEAGVAVDGEEVVDAFAGLLNGGSDSGVEGF